MEKTKRKGNPQQANRRFAIILVGFIAFSSWVIISLVGVGYHFYPFVALQQPFTHLTPILYLAVSLFWLPFAIKHRRIYGFSKNHWILVSLCLLSMALMTGFQYLLFANDVCFPGLRSIPNTPFAIFKGWLCPSMGALF